MNKKNILVIGSGGREHAIVKALKKSSEAGKIYCAPGNAGIAEDAECIEIGVENIEALLNFAQRNNIDLTVVGPEASLAAGIADAFNAVGMKIFGPVKEAARIESSKEFAKEVMKKANVPTAGYQSFSEFDKALKYVKSRPLPAVIKYDGLAAGKGVVIANSYEEAEKALADMLTGHSFGQGKVVIEDFLEGPEFSFMCMVNGTKVYPLAIAQDHKRAYDGDNGPNTGGMGAYSLVPFISEEVRQKALNEIMIPVARTLTELNKPFTGILYGGLILTDEGPKVIEFNARFGDPETEVVLPRLESDFLELVENVLEGKDYDIKWNPEACIGIVLAAEGYPGSYQKNLKIDITPDSECEIFHMGTKKDGEKLLSSGGRVLMVTAKGKTLEEANKKALKGVEGIRCEGLFHRTDIGKQALKN